MEEGSTVLAPPARLFERLSLLASYTWDQTCFPFHSVSKRYLPTQPEIFSRFLRVMTIGMYSALSISIPHPQSPTPRKHITMPVPLTRVAHDLYSAITSPLIAKPQARYLLSMVRRKRLTFLWSLASPRTPCAWSGNTKYANLCMM